MKEEGGKRNGKDRGKKRNGEKKKKGERRLVADNTKSSMIPMAEKNPVLQKGEGEKKKYSRSLVSTSSNETDLSEEAADISRV